MNRLTLLTMALAPLAGFILTPSTHASTGTDLATNLTRAPFDFTRLELTGASLDRKNLTSALELSDLALGELTLTGASLNTCSAALSIDLSQLSLDGLILLGLDENSALTGLTADAALLARALHLDLAPPSATLALYGLHLDCAITGLDRDALQLSLAGGLGLSLEPSGLHLNTRIL